MRKKTYSKKRAEQSALVSQCFAGSSSPARSETVPHVPMSGYALLNSTEETPLRIIPSPDSPAKNTRDQCRIRATKKASQDESKNNEYRIEGEIDDLVQRLELVDMTGDSRDVKPIQYNSARGTRNALKNILSSRDINEVGGARPRAKRKDRATLKDKLSIDLLQSRLKDLDLSKGEKSTTAESDHDQPECREASPTPSAARTRRRKADNELAVQLDVQRETEKAKVDFLSYSKPLLSLCSDPIGRSAPTPFQAWADDISQFFNITKIAEASYGEVYRLSLRSSELGMLQEGESVLKLIALKPPPPPPPPPRQEQSSDQQAINAEMKAKESKKILAMSGVADVTSEARLLRHLSPVPGFTNFREIRVLQGRLAKQFVAAWKYHNKNVKKSLFPDPGRKTSYGEDQLWAVVEMQDAGTDIETVIERQGQKPHVSIWAAWDIFWSVACAVGKAEEWTGFEHRDLHMGNICIRYSGLNESPILDPDQTTLNLTRTIGYTGLETTVIDYTLSRADMSNTENDVAFFDLSKDPAIFEGDGNQDYQYDMYRAMRSAVLHGDPTVAGFEHEKGGDYKEDFWRESHPMTNLIWLHFILFKLMELLPCDDELTSEEENDGTLALGRELKARLARLAEELDLGRLSNGGFRKTADVIESAVEQGWLAEEDVIGLNGDDQSYLEMSRIQL